MQRPDCLGWLSGGQFLNRPKGRPLRVIDDGEDIGWD